MITTLRIMLTGLLIATTGTAENHDLFNGFAPDWRDSWKEQSLFSKPTVYRTIQDSGRPVLHASSESANSGLLRKMTLYPEDTSLRLRWRWKIKQSLKFSSSEQTRSGDDYTARVCVIFEESIIPLRTRSLHYVWSAREPAGAIYPSPYSRQVGMLVMRSGETQAGQWLNEERDLIADYQRYFGRSPQRISAIGIVVDTDNTQTRGEAWFSDLVLEQTPLETTP